MTITIQLSEEHAAILSEQAANEGLTVDLWLQRLAEQQAQPTPLKRAEERPSWQVVTDIMRSVPAEVLDSLPTDGASEHDHYIYGWPKRNQA